ncbi:type 1 glutamine amidotransferase [Geminisphaera colitermitum]|uniref:type 1 glutamine amidotransferase n=1 Tax=Geminisphaera colitermitum TaxID=1148786 RepID=UPI000158D4D8|nr:type 1 glutamine amidotransferase [Geminisphaera colitermitum]
MHVHWFQHVPFEGLGLIEPWLRARGHRLTVTRFYAGELPDLAASACDWLIVMGGPMNIYQYRDHPWLRDEKRAIRARIDAGARVFGVCLGAQLIADVLGGRVYQNHEREIGWFPVRAADTGKGTAPHPLSFPPGESLVFHWHGDTFDLPPGAVLLASNEACRNQAFALSLPGDGNARVLGLQFHLEMDEPAVARICQNCADELTPATSAIPASPPPLPPHVQTADVILARTPSAVPDATALLHRLLERMERG